MKPLFVPVYKSVFAAFVAGTKRDEWRPYGVRWNERTLITGRGMILSCGYSGPRLSATIVSWSRVSARRAPRSVLTIYPNVRTFVRIELDLTTEKETHGLE
jgi:hypothetical protein